MVKESVKYIQMLFASAWAAVVGTRPEVYLVGVYGSRNAGAGKSGLAHLETIHRTCSAPTIPPVGFWQTDRVVFFVRSKTKSSFDLRDEYFFQGRIEVVDEKLIENLMNVSACWCHRFIVEESLLEDVECSCWGSMCSIAGSQCTRRAGPMLPSEMASTGSRKNDRANSFASLTHSSS